VYGSRPNLAQSESTDLPLKSRKGRVERSAENVIHGTDKPCLWLMSMSRYACCIVVVRMTFLIDATHDMVERADLG